MEEKCCATNVVESFISSSICTAKEELGGDVGGKNTLWQATPREIQWQHWPLWEIFYILNWKFANVCQEQIIATGLRIHIGARSDTHMMSPWILYPILIIYPQLFKSSPFYCSQFLSIKQPQHAYIFKITLLLSCGLELTIFLLPLDLKKILNACFSINFESISNKGLQKWNHLGGH